MDGSLGATGTVERRARLALQYQKALEWSPPEYIFELALPDRSYADMTSDERLRARKLMQLHSAHSFGHTERLAPHIPWMSNFTQSRIGTLTTPEADGAITTNGSLESANSTAANFPLSNSTAPTSTDSSPPDGIETNKSRKEKKMVREGMRMSGHWRDYS